MSYHSLMENIFISLFLLGLVSSIAVCKWPAKFLKNRVPSEAKKIKIGLISSTIILFVLFGVSSDTSKTNSKNTQETKTTITPQDTSGTDKPLYEKFSYQEMATVENHVFIYYGQDKSEKYLENLTRQIKMDVCIKPCNIALFDDKKAAELDAQMRTITNEVSEKEWKRKNYVFVADHLPAYLEFEGDGIFFYYIYKDWAYRELVGSP